MMRPYRPQALPLEELRWGELVRSVGESSAAVARFDGMVSGMRSPDVLLSPLTTQEAVLSSRIEGTQATLQEVLRFDADEVAPFEKRHDIGEVLNYRRAMRLAERSLEERPLSLTLIRSIHAELMSGVRGEDKAPGASRTEQNWIGSPGCRLEEARYIPPHPFDVVDSLENFERYLTNPLDDPIVQAGILHAQFEIIHPFMDGNGRVGRMLIPLYLMQRGVLRSPIFYISEELEARRPEYYDRLLGVTERRDWEGWLKFFLGIVAIQAERNAARALKMLALYERMKSEFAQITQSRFVIQALDGVFENPIFSSTGFSARSQIPRASAARMLNQLSGAGFLRQIVPGSGRSPSVYAFDALIEIAEAR